MYRIILKFSIYILLSTVFISCKNGRFHKDNFSIHLTHQGKDLQTGDSLTLSITAKKDLAIDSVVYFYHGNRLKTGLKNQSVQVVLQKPLGRRKLTATIYREDQSLTLSKKIILHPKRAPIIYGYKIINTYPHDPMAFTQGLEFYQDTLYESTGLHGASSLRKVDLKTGKILKKTTLGQKYFGEGITLMNGKIYWLTWQAGIGFVYDAHRFQKLRTFKYAKSKEGWGLCNNGKVIYKSDGTNKIWILDPETLTEKSYIEPVTNHTLATKVNELEWVDGKIYANTWQKAGILIIDPQTGAVTGVIDLRGLKDHLGNKRKANVLNGIAYNPKTGKLYVTGKRWDTLFEIEIVKK